MNLFERMIGEADAIKRKSNDANFKIAKADDDKRLVFGWALVSATADGQQIIDHQGDIVDQDELEEGAYEYVLNFRDAGEEHIGTLRKKARMVESVVFTEEKLQAMGIPLGTVPYGWWIGFYVDDDNTWELIKNGTYKMFSIEGRAIREPVDEPLTKADRVNGCGVLVVRNDKILTATRIGGKHRNQICGPGGHIEPGETYEEAAVREAREEFGIECKNLKPLGIMDGGRNYGKSAIFLCTEYDGKPQTDEEEMTAIKWRSLDELDGERLFKPFEQSLDLITEEVGAVAKTFSELMKFNPYHDRLGRFTTGGGFGVSSSMYTGDKNRQAVTFSANPDTRAGAMAIARRGGVVPTAYGKPSIPEKQPKAKNPEQKQTEDNKKEDTMYPKKLGGVERGKEMSFEEANHGTTNPNFNKGGGYRINCQTCVVANEARRRGYDVTARPKDTQEANALSRNTRLAWIDKKTGKMPEFMPGCKDITTPKQAKKYLEDNLKEGERYNLSHSWKGRRSSGHIITAFKENGNVTLYDPQSGKKMTGNEVNSYLNRIKYKTTSYGYKFNLGIEVLRVDNLQFNTQIVNKILAKGA